MTETVWSSSTDPRQMLDCLLGKASDRKLRLFGVACCGQLRPLLRPKRLRRAVKLAERYAEGKAGAAEMAQAARSLNGMGGFAARAAHWVAADDAGQAAAAAIECVAAAVADAWGENDAPRQAALLRCIFGDPFRPVVFKPTWLSWRDGLVVSMARKIYDSRDFTDMPVLADALEEAGCGDEQLLGHLRGPGPHVRGAMW